MRIYNGAEILKLMKDRGLENIRAYGDFAYKPYELGISTHPVFIGQKV